ncbi:MAG: site-specific DNA-methyltransferase [Chloroflexi bacterium]|nr:site-specific DNA-methyltransferase [Chloroflexota bacterium]
MRGVKVSDKGGKKRHRLSPGEPLALEKAAEAEEARDFPVNRIYHGDCLDIISQMPSDFVDLIVTSPPYNFGLDQYDAHRDTKSWDDYFSQLGRVWAECARVLKSGGRICVVVQPMYSDYMPTHHRISQQLRDLGLLFKAEILWEKHNWNAKYTAWGSWKSPSMPYLKYTWEFIEVFCKGSQKKAGNRANADIIADEFKKWVYGKWEIAPESRMKDFGHPSMFPEEIPYRLIRLFSYKGDLMLDPFNGVGTTTLVARKLGRSYLGIDISERYCEVAQQRLEEYERQQPIIMSCP